MPENQRKINISTNNISTDQTAPPSLPPSRPAPQPLTDADPAAPSNARRSPVTDLLFDTPLQRSGTAPGAGNAEASANPDRHRPVYHISIVAAMVETHPQTLRMYERMGLVAPQRTPNNIRLYSENDVEQVRRIQHLTQDLGVNLAGVEVVFKLLREMNRLREEMEAEIEAEIQARRDALQRESQSRPE